MDIENNQAKNEKRKAIASAALAVFKRKGFAQTRIEDISTKANIAKGTFYLYFPSRNAILEYLFENFIGQGFIDSWDNGHQSDPLDEVLYLIDMVFERSTEHFDFVTIFWEVAGHQTVQSDCGLNMRISKFFNKLSELITRLLTNAKNAGRLDDRIDIVHFSRSIISAIDGIILHSAIFGSDAGVIFNKQKEAFMHMLKCSLKANQMPQNR